MDAATDIREQILTAAEQRFRRFGFNKTTMAEIAGDCGMSAANLYRYFESKADIAGAIAEQFMALQLELVRQVVDGPAPSAAAKIEAFILTLFHHTYDTLAQEPLLAELVAFIGAERKDLIRCHKEGALADLLAEIIHAGNRTGEFAVEDPARTAPTLLKATAFFHAPPLILLGLHTRPEMEQMAREMAAFLTRALQHRPHTPQG